MVTRLRVLALTDEILARLADVARAEDTYLPGGESASVIEIPKLKLADAVLKAVDEQAGLRGRPPIRPLRGFWSERRRDV